MKEATDKKAKRNENKKKKMLAEIELYRLRDEKSEMCGTSKRAFNDVDDPSNNSMNVGSEPEPKRQKKDNNEQSVECETQPLDTSNTSTYIIQQNNNTIVHGEELVRLRQALRERKKKLKNLPRLRLRNTGVFADLSQGTKRTPLFLDDVQHLLMYSQLGQHSPYDPRWATLEKSSEIAHTILILVEGVSVYDYISTESVCPNLAKMDLRIELVSPFTYGGSIVEEICAVPLSKTQKAKLERKFGNLTDAVQSSDKVFKVLRSMFPIYITPKDGDVKPKSKRKKFILPDKFPRTELLLSAWQLVEEGYPLPLQGELSTRYSSYVLTKEEYAEVTPQSPMWAVDCEMCQTKCGNELTRISIVNEDLQVVYESLVKPHNRIINYLTKYSGITPAMLKNVTKSLEDVQTDLRELLPSDVILVGQSLNMDLHAMKMMHPYVIDTSVIFNLSGERHRKSKLSLLTATFLNEAIQQGSSGHDSIEDSSASLKLVQLKLSKSPEFGDAVLCGRHTTNRNTGPENLTFLENSKAEDVQEIVTNNEFNLATSLFSHVTGQNKSVSLISSNDVLTEYTPFITAAAFGTEAFTKVECQAASSNAEAVEKTLEVIPKHQFCLTHLTLGTDENIANIDLWTSQLLENCPNNSLVIVVLAGSPSSSSNGAAFLQIRSPSLVSPRTGLPIAS